MVVKRVLKLAFPHLSSSQSAVSITRRIDKWMLSVHLFCTAIIEKLSTTRKQRQYEIYNVGHYNLSTAIGTD